MYIPKLTDYFSDLETLKDNLDSDPQIRDIINNETNRQITEINLIPSENITSKAVRAAVSSSLMHKYSEGNIGSRYYQGNQYIDEIEALAINRASKLFDLEKFGWHVNVQALSGSNANLAAIIALLNPNDTIMSMFLPDGGHLSHGWSYVKEGKPDLDTLIYEGGDRKVHIVAKLFNIVQYATDPKTHLLDYDKIETAAIKYKPKLIITGGTAYPRNIDYLRIKEIAAKVDAMYLADIAHEAGLIASKLLPSPVGIADIVTLTTHKSLRAARGALILSNEETIAKVNKAILPGLQGGPFNNNIAGIAVGLLEAMHPDFISYSQQILSNSQALANRLKSHGFNLITGGTDKHLILIDVSNLHNADKTLMSGKEAAMLLAKEGIIVNMNTIPWDKNPPNNPSGIRLGTPLVTTLGYKEEDMHEIADRIANILIH